MRRIIACGAVAGLVSFCACSGSSGGGGGTTGGNDADGGASGAQEGGASGATDGGGSVGKDAASADAASTGNLSCGGFPVSGGDTNAAGAFQYLAQQTQKCACDTTNTFGGAGKAGDPCTTYKDCALGCCTCTNSARQFGADVCQGGKCVDAQTACADVLAVSFATAMLCP